jgi:CheY-like chemotaxis protein
MILLVEDDDVARGAAASMLQVHGYRVLECNGGRDAVLLLEQHRGSVAVLVLDLIMANGSGQWLLAQLSRRPELVPPRVIITTALPDPSSLPPVPAPVLVLQKPFAIEQLEELIDQDLGPSVPAAHKGPVEVEGGKGAAGAP